MSYNGSVNHSDRQLRGNIRQTTAQNNEAVSPIGEDYIPRFSEQCSATSGYMEIQQQSISHDQQHDASSENHLLPNTVELNVPLDPMPRKRMTKPNVKDKLITWWWWWEIMAMVLSFACMCAIVVLLTKIDNIPLQSWWLPIQPNSLIAALTTIGKAALMVPAASCISQLKWRHFFLRPRGLADLELFDEASRGPWGSALLIARLCLRPHVLVVMGFAFVTIVALGIDTAIQQVLDFPLRATPLDNSTIEMGVANDYFSKGFIEIPDHCMLLYTPHPFMR